MNKLLVTAALLGLLAATPAKADVIMETKLSGTGENVVFNSLTGDLATALLNGQFTDTVRFRDLTGSTTFTAAANGNDIKISGSNNLFIQVFDGSQNLLGTTVEVFSLNGTGQASAFVQAVDQFGVAEPIQAFDLGTLDPNSPSNFTFTAINGEVMTSLRILDLTGNITSFEHYRITTAIIPQVAAVPELSTWVMMILGFVGVGGIATLKRRQGEHPFRLA